MKIHVFLEDDGIYTRLMAVQVYVTGFIPYVGKALNFLLLSWMYAYYCFEYVGHVTYFIIVFQLLTSYMHVF